MPNCAPEINDEQKHNINKIKHVFFFQCHEHKIGKKPEENFLGSQKRFKKNIKRKKNTTGKMFFFPNIPVFVFQIENTKI